MQQRQKKPFDLSRNEPRAKTKRDCKMAAGNGEKTCWESLSALSFQSNFLFLMNMKHDWNECEPQGCTRMQETALYCAELILTPHTHTHLCTPPAHTRSWADAAIHGQRNMCPDMWRCQMRCHTLNVTACIKNAFWNVVELIIVDALTLTVRTLKNIALFTTA